MRRGFMTVPDHLRRYPCDEYFASEWATTGLWDEPSQITLVLSAAEIEELPGVPFLVVSRVGDGVALGYRPSHPGLWAYLREDREFALMAPSLVEFVDRFYAGREGL
jgi:hypothetical protein